MKAEVKYQDQLAGWISKNEEGFHFEYDINYIQIVENKAISISMPKRKEKYSSKTLFPFFDGLIPEGWLLQMAEKNWKINPRDRFGLLLACCNDCIGAVSIHAILNENINE
jgi:serine/threonine-protein kinase HipA